MAEIDDKEWLDLLAGRFVDVNNPNQKRNADALRAAIKKLDAENSAQVDGLNKMIFRMTREGLFLDQDQMTGSKKIILFVKKIRLLIVFIIGIISGVIIPVQQLATRGGADEPVFLFDLHTKNKNINSYLSLTAHAPITPLGLAQMIQLAAIESNLEVKTSGVIDSVRYNNIKEIKMTIYGLKSMDESQKSLKILLQASNQLSGTVEVTIKASHE